MVGAAWGASLLSQSQWVWSTPSRYAPCWVTLLSVAAALLIVADDRMPYRGRALIVRAAGLIVMVLDVAACRAAPGKGAADACRHPRDYFQPRAWVSLQWSDAGTRGMFAFTDGGVNPGGCVDTRKTFLSWPVVRQFTGADPLGRGPAVRSESTEHIEARTESADRVARSVCPYCAVGCGQRVYVKDEKVIQIEGDPDSPISRGRLCPKGSASKNLVTSPLRQTMVRYRRPYATEWEDLDLSTAMNMIADRVVKARNDTWQELDERGLKVRRTLGIASLGGATLDNEENYLIKKLFTAMGAIQIENQARI